MESKILVVDDEEFPRVNLRKLLGREGHLVEVASSAGEALDKLKSDGYNIVITDIVMPDMDGVELLKKIKAKDRGVYVIMMTSYATLERAIASLKHGADDFIQKPYENSEMLEAVEKANKTLEAEARFRGKEPSAVIHQNALENLKRNCSDCALQLEEAVKKLTGMDVRISVERLVNDEVENFPNLVGSERKPMIGSYVSLYGGLYGSMAMLLPLEDAVRFVEVLSDRKIFYAPFVDSHDREIIMEVSRIFSEAFAKKLGDIIDFEVKTTPPSFADFVSGNFVRYLELRLGRTKKYYIAHELSLSIENKGRIVIYFLLILDLRNLNALNTTFPNSDASHRLP
jgi:DNA-binding response OmpR family regulator